MLLRVLVLPFLLGVLDIALTLHFQSPDYWAGNYAEGVQEANLALRMVLSVHPLLVIPAFLLGYLVIGLVVWRAPAWIGYRLCVFQVLGHSIAIIGWLLRYHQNCGWMIVLLVAFTVPAAALCLAPYRDQWNSRERLVV